ncbi:MAG: hypothetical protein WA419_10520 [Silvibacterium sp.]
MPNEPEGLKAPELDESKTSKTPEKNETDRIANEAAARAKKTEKRYDRQHGTFPRGGPSGIA